VEWYIDVKKCSNNNKNVKNIFKRDKNKKRTNAEKNVIHANN